MQPAISQSLIKEIFKKDCCPRQIFYAFVEGRDLLEPSEAMKIGRYFESELLGSCRGGEKQEPKLIKGGEKAAAYRECDEIIAFAREVFRRLSLDFDKKNVQVELKADYLKGSLDLIAKDIQGKGEAIYDLKYTATQPDDIWNGWGDPESKTDAHLQAIHYVFTYFKKYGKYVPFYFLVFGKSKWVKVIKVKVTKEAIDLHIERIKYVSEKLREFEKDGFKGNGTFNKCLACPFYNECPDKSNLPEIETITI